MSGNVFEWCSDGYQESYPEGPVVNPHVGSLGLGRIGRGGSWYSIATDCRSADRYYFDPYSEYGDLGFRVVAIPLEEMEDASESGAAVPAGRSDPSEDGGVSETAEAED